eukprot:TRINITY_DN7347_c0_g1_i3.p1 TRINITY_DN7347_c0_g1~~TRINITY_DN7347_c0_g1_i3.p1  ORF type:complete len:151 (+),score=40.20 TRINITY_DN7347_c0_g1_i3:279-731(+)
MRNLPDSSDKITKVCARGLSSTDGVSIEDMLEYAGLRSQEAYGRAADACISENVPGDEEYCKGLVYHVLAGNSDKAITTGVAALFEIMSNDQEGFDVNACLSIVDSLHCVDTSVLAKHTKRTEFLAYMNYFGTLQAIWKGYGEREEGSRQ